MATQYREQYDRVRRWHARFEQLDKGRPHDAVSDNYVDEIYAFFLNCYHLKDWIKHDSSVPTVVQGQVEGYINSNRALQLCADISNSLKHLAPLRTPRSAEHPTFGKKGYALALGGGPAVISLKYEVATVSGVIDAFTLATDCVAAWDAFLRNSNLL